MTEKANYRLFVYTEKTVKSVVDIMEVEQTPKGLALLKRTLKKRLPLYRETISNIDLETNSADGYGFNETVATKDVTGWIK